MSPEAKHYVLKLAQRVVKDPTSATVDDVRKLAKAWVLLVTGKAP